jgi:hypothetical protein
MIKFFTIFILSLFAISTQGLSDPSHMPKIEGSKEFNRLKTLVGTWEGMSEMGMKGEAQKINILYKLTSNNSAIVETLSPGTPHEMVSVYHDINGKLSMKHYCALGNQPLMELNDSDDSSISLVFAANNTLDPNKEPHMHALNIVFENDDSIVQNWTHQNGSEGKEVHTFKLTRVK